LTLHNLKHSWTVYSQEMQDLSTPADSGTMLTWLIGHGQAMATMDYTGLTLKG